MALRLAIFADRRWLYSALALAMFLAACGTSAPNSDPEQAEEPEVVAASPAPTEAVQDNLAKNAGIRAEDERAGHPAVDALDGDPETYWASEAQPPRAIELDLGIAMDIGGLMLTTYQSEGATTVHSVYGKGPDEEDEYTLLHEFSGVSEDGQPLEHSPEVAWSGIRFLRIETTEGPASSGWREIFLLVPAQTPFGDLQSDIDSDGLPDVQDWCPETPGTYENNGC